MASCIHVVEQYKTIQYNLFCCSATAEGGNQQSLKTTFPPHTHIHSLKSEFHHTHFPVIQVGFSTLRYHIAPEQRLGGTVCVSATALKIKGDLNLCHSSKHRCHHGDQRTVTFSSLINTAAALHFRWKDCKVFAIPVLVCFKTSSSRAPWGRGHKGAVSFKTVS